MIVLALVLAAAIVMGCSAASIEDEEIRYFRIQSKVIQALIAQEFETMIVGDKPGLGLESGRSPSYLYQAFHGNWQTPKRDSVDAYRALGEDLLDGYNVKLSWSGSTYYAYDKSRGRYFDIYERRDWKTIRSLVEDCNELLETKGRLACEFDGGHNYAETPFTTILFNVAYLKYQSQQIGYRDGRYELIDKDESAVPLDIYNLLTRNAIARLICYQLSVGTSSLLVNREQAYTSSAEPGQIAASLPKTSGYKDLHKYYVWYQDMWRVFTEKGLKVAINWADSGFEAVRTETGEKIVFPPDEDLIKEALEQLNYYNEKCDFVSYFQIWNYPMFLLSVLSLYDANLEWDEESKRYVILPGPTDPKRFFEIVSDFTFVNDPSEVVYLKKHLHGWMASRNEESAVE